jgi:ParB family transcriptional regulator, chromosome partitioning protein
MSPRNALGKGLGSLIPTEVDGDEDSVFRYVATERIVANQFQPRKHFDEEALEALTASVKEMGVLQPILLREIEDGQYELIAGERRWRSAQRAGLDEIPAIVRDVSDVASLAEAVVENIHRQDLNPLEEAAAYRQLLDDFELTHEELAVRMGKSRATISNTLRLLQLPAPVQRLVADQELTAGHARAILAVPERSAQEALAQRIVSEGLSVRAAEEAAKPTLEVGKGETRSAPASLPLTRDPALLELEEILSERFATNVGVTVGTKRGKIVIDFADIADLERIYRLLLDK